ncbi:MAG: response regulator transcription factor [Planctomycetaceae bacterium]
MQQGRARVVVGEGRAARKGLLRFVLEGEGFDVVGEAPDAAELAKLLAVEQPDVVVLDDGIGVTAVQLTHEVAPSAKVVLVWPGAVVPIGGDARVEPSEVLRGLGPAVSQVAGLAGLLESFERPDWIDKVRKDPATLRELLAKRGAEETPDRPSIIELQRRAQQAEPAKEPVPAASDEEDDEHVAPVLILPTAASAEPTIVLPPAVVAASAPPAPPAHAQTQEEDEDVAGVAAVASVGAVAAAQPDPIATEFNRRLGTIALGGAALIGAVVLSLGVSASRVPVSVVNANPSVITSSPPPPPPASPTGTPTGGATYPPTPPGGNQTHHHHGGPGPVTLGATQLGNGGGGNGGGTDTTHGKAHQHHGHNDDPTPGHSGEHNPHGGPPGHKDPKPSSPPPKTDPGHHRATSHGNRSALLLHRHKR